jgi:general secretion pathway protein G
MSGRDRRGFTIIEMLAVIAIVGVLSSIGYARTSFVLEQAKVARAIGDLVTISQELATMDTLPASLAAIKRGHLLDPWGRAYVYYPFPAGIAPPNDARQDRFLVPINTRFDLYSLGPDGQAMPPLTASQSRDDIVVAGDGGFTGRALEY